MFKNHKNQVGDINGNYNQVIQIILSDGEKVVEKLGILVDRLITQEKQEIETLNELIFAKEETLKDKRKIVESQDIEIIRLKAELSEKQKQIEESEKRFSEIYLENNGKDFSRSEGIYPTALQALINGNKDEALKILERQKLLDQKTKLDKEKEQQSASWLLRADLLKDEDNWSDELNECFDFAVEIHSNWGNNLVAANHYKFINNLIKAEYYYQICLQKASSESEKACTLNNLAVLQRAKNEFVKAEKSCLEALQIYRKLAVVNQQSYLPNVGITLNNLANLQRAKNEFVEAEKSYLEALQIYRKLAEVNPQAYLPDVGMTLNNLANLQSDKNEFVKAENSYLEALQIYRKLAVVNPQAYLPDVGMTLNNLAVLQSDKNEFVKAQNSYLEALQIYRKLAEVNPQAYLPNLAMTQINMGIFYQEARLDKKLSIQYVDEAITNLLSIQNVGYFQDYLKRAINVLKDWGVNIEEYIEKKLTDNSD